MPTPSSNPPPDPSSPPPYSFSTCPDDLQLPPRSARESQDGPRPQIVDDMEVRRDGSIHDASPAAFDARPARDGPTMEDDTTLDDQTSAEPSSRSTTMSPRPQSSATSVMSPPSTMADADAAKRQDARYESLLSREATPASSRHLQGLGAGFRNASSRDTRSTDHEVDTPDQPLYDDGPYSPSVGPEYSSKRAIPVSPSSFLRPGSKFHGTQQSERQVYDVQVEIKHVDMRESFLCGYLRIQGLTEDHPTLTTYFEGEIIGSKYSFHTQHDDWGASSKVDLQHWAKFSAFRPFQKLARKGPVTIPDVSQKDTIFMRWKEHFLVPDHRVRTITGASFEGFYYICFDQLKGEVSGIYFHSKSEKFQQLELKHVPDRGCFSATEFR